MMKNKKCVLYCRCGSDGIPSGYFDLLTESLKKTDADVYEINDLCAFSLNERDILNSLSEDYEHKIVIACYPRAVKALFDQTGVSFDYKEVLGTKELFIEQIRSKLEENNIKSGTADYKVYTSTLDVPAWFPVVDHSRCTLCGQCANFCLFGVYHFDKKSLKVVNPLACKNKCPACGRSCPGSAIIFPRLNEKSVVAGAEPGEDQSIHEGENGNLIVMLNERNRSVKNIFRQNIMEFADRERKKALEESIKDKSIKE